MLTETEIFPDGVEMVFSSDMDSVDMAVAVFKRRFSARFSGMMFKAALVLREMLTNAVAHGNCLQPDRMVSCWIEPVGDDCLRVVVKDEGKGFCREGMTFELPEDPLTDRNRGLALVHAYSESVTFNAAGNQVEALLKYKGEALDGIKSDETK